MPALGRLTPRRWTIKPPAGTGLNTTTSLAQGLVGFWPMNEGAGPRLQALGAADMPATAVGSTWSWRAAPAPFYQCPTFPGNTTDYVTVPQQALLSPNAKSVAAWFVTTSAAAVLQSVVIKSLDYLLRIETTRKLAWYIWTSGALRNVQSVVNVPVGVPVFAVGTWDLITLRLYVNGLQVASASTGGTFTPGTNDLTFAGDTLAVDSLYGSLGSVGLWNRGLTAAEVMELYVNPFALFARPRALLPGPPVASAGGGTGGGIARLNVGRRPRGPGMVAYW